MRKPTTILILVLCAICSVARADIYVVSVGVAKYQRLNALHLCDDDARAISTIYKTHTEHVVTLTDQQATRENIVQAMTSMFSRAKENDMVVFFFSGHGYKGGLCPYDMGSRNKNGLSYQAIYDIFSSCKAKRKIILADACKSGGLRKEDTRATSPYGSSSDVILFLSSRTKENSIENPYMKNGFFTAYLERGLRGGADENRDRKVTAKEIFNFVSNGVKQLSQNKQHPVMWGNFDDNFIILDWR